MNSGSELKKFWLSSITERHWADECRHPTIDLIASLKKRRLKNIREETWMLADGEDRWTAKGALLIAIAEKVLEAGKYEEGFILEDAPKHNNIEELLRATPEEWDAALSVFAQPFTFGNLQPNYEKNNSPNDDNYLAPLGCTFKYFLKK